MAKQDIVAILKTHGEFFTVQGDMGRPSRAQRIVQTRVWAGGLWGVAGRGQSCGNAVRGAKKGMLRVQARLLPMWACSAWEICGNSPEVCLGGILRPRFPPTL